MLPIYDGEVANGDLVCKTNSSPNAAISWGYDGDIVGIPSEGWLIHVYPLVISPNGWISPYV